MRRIYLGLFEACFLISLLTAQQPAVAPIAGLRPGVYRYKASLRMEEPPIDFNITIVIQESAGEWTVTETTKAALSGEISDTGVYDKKSLMLIARAFKRGPASIDLAFRQNRIEGKAVMDGQANPIDVKVDGPLFGDGPAFIFSIGVLPLAKGYSDSFRSFDIEKLKPDLTRLKVADLENVRVPAGLFESYRIEISSTVDAANNYTVWIAKNSLKPVKMITVLPELGGAKLTVELQ